jgi:hypothetical protein
MLVLYEPLTPAAMNLAPDCLSISIRTNTPNMPFPSFSTLGTIGASPAQEPIGAFE